MVCLHMWQGRCKSALTLPQTAPLQGGNAETDTQFIFGSVTVCQWPQMHRKGRLWDINRPWFDPTSLTLFAHSACLSSSHPLTSLFYAVVCCAHCLTLTFVAVLWFALLRSLEITVWRYINNFCMTWHITLAAMRPWLSQWGQSWIDWINSWLCLVDLYVLFYTGQGAAPLLTYLSVQISLLFFWDIVI